ncbi:FMN-binding protein [Kitasatospora viridis]|uniref:Uncharacterized protein with FMN-binding domain n=1 Tax=Kitasatospora viridis TaxID=281105 RepID=A0A561UDM0_9ACTN|nr:FMN-binding protein [Kitasatospora viridis]TWF97470.1 uncharacterized protein with FMN-binding domain [Kitasatospora viridis]
MRRMIITSAATAAGIVLLLSLKPHGTVTPQAEPVISSDTGSAAPVGDASSGSPSASSPSSPSSAGGSDTKTVTGSAIDTRYGPVQVRITVTGGKLTKVDVLQYPTESNRDVEINTFAIPQLNQEAITAGNANIDSVSGATYTTDGYTRSLQSALDQAGVH